MRQGVPWDSVTCPGCHMGQKCHMAAGRREGEARKTAGKSQGWAELHLSVLFTHPLAGSSVHQREPVLGLGLGLPRVAWAPRVTPLPLVIASAGQGAPSVPLTPPPLSSPHRPTPQRGSRPHR